MDEVQGNYSQDTGYQGDTYEADIFNRLSAPFAPDDIEWRIQSSGIKNDSPWAKVLAYVDNRAIMDRLDSVLGNNNWQEEYREIHVGDTGFICRLGIRVNDEWIWKEDGANITQFEPVKGGLSGAMKRVAVKFGIGRYLYHLDTGWAEFVSSKKNARYQDKIDGRWYYWNPPALPTWALPKEKHEFLNQEMPNSNIDLSAQRDWLNDDQFEYAKGLIKDGKIDDARDAIRPYRLSKAKENALKELYAEYKPNNCSN